MRFNIKFTEILKIQKFGILIRAKITHILDLLLELYKKYSRTNFMHIKNTMKTIWFFQKKDIVRSRNFRIFRKKCRENIKSKKKITSIQKSIDLARQIVEGLAQLVELVREPGFDVLWKKTYRYSRTNFWFLLISAAFVY